MRNIPTITKNLLIINIIAFIAYLVLRRQGIDLNDMFGLHIFLASNFNFYQPVTYMFMHGGWDHLFFNMFALWMFGCVIERVWGPKRFIIYYMVCGIGAGLIQEIAQFIEIYAMNADKFPLSHFFNLSTDEANLLNSMTTVGASGAIYGILLAFGMIFPEERIFIFPLPVPIKAKWFVMIYVVIELMSALGTSNSGVAHFAHLGGMLFGFFLIRYWQRHPELDARYGRSVGRQFFDNMQTKWNRQTNRKPEPPIREEENERPQTDWGYNTNKKRKEDEIDRILDKIRKSGYDSLTDEEKKRLFDQSKLN